MSKVINNILITYLFIIIHLFIYYYYYDHHHHHHHYSHLHVARKTLLFHVASIILLTIPSYPPHP